MGKTHSKPLAARRGRGTAWALHGKGMLCVNRPLQFLTNIIPLSESCCFKHLEGTAQTE